MEERISVIVPVYKVEPYLDQCVGSIVAQTYKNLEIILVDDGSPDNCPAMCDAWARKDFRIRVVHKENGGLSDARNAGLAVATGDHIGFVDGDDHIAPTMYEQLMAHLTDTGSDIAACGVQMVWEDGKTALLTQPGHTVLDNVQAMEALISETWLKQPVWYKLYKRSTVEGILFEKGKCHEDVFWSYQPIARANRVCVFDTPLYFYRQRSDSIMGNGFSEKRLDALEAMEQRLQFLQRAYPMLTPENENRLFAYSMYLMQYALRSPKKSEAIRTRLQEYARAHRPKAQLLREMPLGTRFWQTLACVSFIGTCKLRNAFGRGIE